MIITGPARSFSQGLLFFEDSTSTSIERRWSFSIHPPSPCSCQNKTSLPSASLSDTTTTSLPLFPLCQCIWSIRQPEDSHTSSNTSLYCVPVVCNVYVLLPCGHSSPGRWFTKKKNNLPLFTLYQCILNSKKPWGIISALTPAWYCLLCMMSSCLAVIVAQERDTTKRESINQSSVIHSVPIYLELQATWKIIYELKRTVLRE